MNADEFKHGGSQRQELLGQLKAAEAALRSGLHTQGFGSTARAHMERAMAHIRKPTSPSTKANGRTVRNSWMT